MRRWLSPCVVAALSLGGCSTARLADGFAEAGQTRIRVSPRDFVGQVPCVQGAEGALQSYTVTLRQVSSDGQQTPVPDGGVSTDLVSPPVACDRAVFFPALAYRYYAATISGFDRLITEAEVGSATPRWVAECGAGGDATGGSGLAPTRAQLGLTVPLQGCTSFSDGNPGPGGSRLNVDVAAALGTLHCGSGPGEVAFFEARLGTLRKSVPCGQALVFNVSGPARYHSIELTGFELGPDAGVTPAPVQPGAPDGGPLPPDAGLPAAATDAGAGDAGPIVPAAGLLVDPDAGSGDAGSSAVGLAGTARWRTQCLGRSVPGVVTSADCAPLQPLAP
jgi:hypothetical protein